MHGKEYDACVKANAELLTRQPAREVVTLDSPREVVPYIPPSMLHSKAIHPSCTNMHHVQLKHTRVKRANARILVGTANLGNAMPNVESIAQWIPPDGLFVECVEEENLTTILDEHEAENDEGDRNDILQKSSTETERSAVPYQIKYPLRYSLEDDPSPSASGTAAKEEEVVFEDALSKQLDLIVIGLQEATFDPPKLDRMSSDSESVERDASVRIQVPMVKPLRKLQTLRTAKDFSERSNAETNQSDNHFDHSSRSPRHRVRLITGRRLMTVKKKNWEDGTHVLHSLFEGRLPSYTRLVSYQRGQMRLMVFGRTQSSDLVLDPPLPLQVLHTAAQNTGLAGLANKGGIVAEVLVNHTTRLSFVSCHLEAHEGSAKCAIRCQTLRDILRGTAARKKSPTLTATDANNLDGESQHHIVPSMHSTNHSSNMAIDVSLTSHYSFVLGDLNFRTDLTLLDSNFVGQDDAHKKSVQNMVKEKDWTGLNRVDELRYMLRDKECLVGFQTLVCNFPPTFKLERQAGYTYVDKRRPSYTDRVLFKTGHELENGIKPLLYEPVDNFTTSDHKPVRAAFTVELNPSFRVRPKAVRRQSMRWAKLDTTSTAESGVLHPQRSLASLCCGCMWKEKDVDDNVSRSSNTSVVDLSHGQGLGLSGDQLQLFVSHMNVVLAKSETSSLHGAAFGTSDRNPYIMLVTQPEEAIRLSSWKRSKRLKRILGHILGKRQFITERTKDGWPCSSTKMSTTVANWEEEEIGCHVSTHAENGGSIELSGTILHLVVMDKGATEDTLVGSFPFNLAKLLKTSTENKNVMFGPRNVQGSVRSSLVQPSSQHHRVVPRSIFGSMFRGVGSISDRRGSGFFSSGGQEGDDEYDEDPFTTVTIDEPLLKGGMEVGRLSCTIEAWWVDETTARVVKVSETRSKPASRRNARSRRHDDAEFRGTIVHTPRGSQS